MPILDARNVKARDAATGAVLIPAIALGLLVLRPGFAEAQATQPSPGTEAPAGRPRSAGEGADRGPAPAGPGHREPGLDAELIAAGWTRDAAEAVARLNAEWFGELDREAPDDAGRQRDLLRRLGRTHQVLDVVARHPEVAGLLAVAIDPVATADSLRDEPHYAAIASLYARYVVPEDAQTLTLALRRHRAVILRLAGRAPAGAELLFLQPEEGPGQREYGRWLDDYCREALDHNDDDLDAAVALMLEHGPALRRRLVADDAFRGRFREDLWPRYARAVGVGLGPETFAWEPRIWDLLGLPDGEALLRRWGLLAVDLLFAPRGAYPADLHPELIRTLLEADNAKVAALYRFREAPLLHRILRRPALTEATRLAFLDRLNAEGTAILARFDQYSDRAFAEELGPPADGPVTWIPLYYTVYEVPRKVLDGRPVPIGEVITALADPFLLFLPGGGKVTEEVFQTTLKNRARQFAARQVGGPVSEKMVAHELVPWIRAAILSQARQLPARGVGLEVTGPVRTLFRVSNLGRKSFSRLTNLEARLFMRRDARVVVRLDKVFVIHFLQPYFEQTARDALEEGFAGMTGGRAPSPGSAPSGPPERTPPPSAVEAWRKNISAWWLMNAGSMTPRELPRSASPGDQRRP